MYAYIPVPDTEEGVNDALRQIGEDLRRLAETPSVPVLTVAPFPPVTGQLVIADGTSWDPGSGRGLYYYDGTWIKV